MDHRVKPGDDEVCVLVMHSPFRAPSSRIFKQLSRRPFLFVRLAFRPFAEKKGGGDAGGFPSSTAICEKRKVSQMNCRHREG
jgi:hypothetical protein